MAVPSTGGDNVAVRDATVVPQHSGERAARHPLLEEHIHVQCLREIPDPEPPARVGIARQTPGHSLAGRVLAGSEFAQLSGNVGRDE
eukprot:12900250-Heterocapsa_arctica.AAC.1